MSKSIVAELPGIDKGFKLKERKDLREEERRIDEGERVNGGKIMLDKANKCPILTAGSWYFKTLFSGILNRC